MPWAMTLSTGVAAENGEGPDSGGFAVDADRLPADGTDAGDVEQHDGRFAARERQKSFACSGSVFRGHPGPGLQGDSGDSFAD